MHMRVWNQCYNRGLIHDMRKYMHFKPNTIRAKCYCGPKGLQWQNLFSLLWLYTVDHRGILLCICIYMHTVLDPEWTIDDLLDIRIWTDTTPGVVLVVVILSMHTRTRVFWSRSAPKCINQCACVTSQTIDRKATTHDSVVSGHVRTPHFSHLRVEISHWCCLSTYSLVGAVKWVDVN